MSETYIYMGCVIDIERSEGKTFWSVLKDGRKLVSRQSPTPSMARNSARCWIDNGGRR